MKPPPPRVILIEDHALVRELLGAMVREQLGLDLVAQCRGVAEGSKACLEHKPDLVILDWMLPDGRGFDIVREAGAKLPKTRWICVSSNEQEHLVREAVELGIHGFVLKKSDLSNLRTAVERVLAGHSYYCAESARLLVEAMRSEAVLASNLTTREREVLRGIARGENPKSIASQLGVNAKTVQNHITMLKDKLGIHEPAGLVRYAIKHGYVEAP